MIYDMAVELGKKYNKPILNNETACLCRGNPYDMTIEMANSMVSDGICSN